MGMAFAIADMVGDYSEYDILMDTFAEACTRFVELEKAVTEVRHLCESCESEQVNSKKVLEVLERYGV
jgi:hypothetical protein